jgi:hypothetical protein
MAAGPPICVPPSHIACNKLHQLISTEEQRSRITGSVFAIYHGPQQTADTRQRNLYGQGGSSIAKYSPWKFGTAIFTGKFIFNEVIVWSAVILGRRFINRLGLLGLSTINSTYLLIAITFSVVTIDIIIYLSLRWAKIIGKWFPWTLDKN